MKGGGAEGRAGERAGEELGGGEGTQMLLWLLFRVWGWGRGARLLRRQQERAALAAGVLEGRCRRSRLLCKGVPMRQSSCTRSSNNRTGNRTQSSSSSSLLLLLALGTAEAVEQR